MPERTEVLLFGPLKPLIVKGLESGFTVHRLADATDREAFLADVSPRVRGIASSVSSMKIGGDFMGRFPKLEILATFGVGYDHVDVSWAAAHGVTVTNTLSSLSASPL